MAEDNIMKKTQSIILSALIIFLASSAASIRLMAQTPVWTIVALTPPAPTARGVRLFTVKDGPHSVHRAGQPLLVRLCLFNESYEVRLDENPSLIVYNKNCIDVESPALTLSYFCPLDQTICTTRTKLLRKLTYGNQVKYEYPYWVAGWTAVWIQVTYKSKILGRWDTSTRAGDPRRGPATVADHAAPRQVRIAALSESRFYEVCGPSDAVVIADGVEIGPIQNCSIVAGKEIIIQSDQPRAGTYQILNE